MKTRREKVVSKVIGGVLAASAAMALIYGAAAAGATSLGESFNTVETKAHTRSVQFSLQATRASAEHAADRVKCVRLAVAKRKACNAEAKMRNARTF
jgi:hypothetical protein